MKKKKKKKGIVLDSTPPSLPKVLPFPSFDSLGGP